MSQKLPFKLKITIEQKPDYIQLSVINWDYSQNMSSTYNNVDKNEIRKALLREIEIYIQDNLS